MYYPFNESIDKITERELVHDILERLVLSKDLKDGIYTNHKLGDSLTDIINKLISTTQSPEVILNYLKIKCGNLRITAGNKSGSVTITGLQDCRVILAQSTQMGIDVKDCLSIASGGAGSIICTMVTDAPYTNDEYIKIYAI